MKQAGAIRFTGVLSRIFSLEMAVVIYFFLLLFFGREFTKFRVAGPLYLHDLTLGILTLLAVNNRRILVQRFNSLLFLILLSSLYLVYSLLFYQPAGEILTMTFRQFNLFLYILCCYLIFNTMVRGLAELDGVIRLLRWIARCSVLLQLLFIVYGYLFIPGFNLFSPGEYNYFSPLVIFGIIGYGALALAYSPNFLIRYFKFAATVGLSTTLGHTSAFFALCSVFFVHLFMLIKPKQRFIAIGIIAAMILSLFFLPQFTDVNAGWRLLYWQHVLERLITGRWAIAGFGFGQEYMTEQYANYLYATLGSPIMLDSYEHLARYLSPPHNSFLTIAFHVGLLPSLLILVPLRFFFKQVFLKPHAPDSNRNFLVYILTGSIVWVAFNVILELPHSATYFWLVYFAAASYLKYTDRENESTMNSYETT